jgi:DNA polymerase-1
MWPTAPGLDDAAMRSVTSGRGRYARNAVVQGAAAEFFKAWAVTVRARGSALDARIVLCLHDELLVHVPADSADAAAGLLRTCLDETAGRWAAATPVRFVADVSIIERWSDAK